MTEAEWLAATEPAFLLVFLRGKVSERKLRLFACACCRHVWKAFTEEPDRQAVEVAERFAEGLATEEERLAAAAMSGEGPEAASFMAGDCLAGYEDSLRVEAGREDHALSGGSYAAECAAHWLPDAAAAAELDRTDVLRWAAAMLRDISGNPFQECSMEPAWRSTTVIALARAIYEERAFDRLPILADALEDAGCTNADILDHCRQPGEHVRGCWAVDLILEQK